MTLFRLPVGRITASVFTSPHATPDLDPLPAILAMIDGAKRTLDFAAYSFTLAPVADAIIAAHTRGVTVRGVCDATSLNVSTTQIPRMAAAGIDVRKWGHAYELMHDKVIICDSSTRKAAVSLGSWNMSSQAERVNVEVLLICTGTQVGRVLAPALTAQIETAYENGSAV